MMTPWQRGLWSNWKGFLSPSIHAVVTRRRYRKERIMNKPVKVPGPDHPITIAPAPGHVTVTVAGTVIADSTRALALQEASYPAVLYIPRDDVRMDLLERTSHT